MRAAFLHEDSRDIEDAVRGATDATDEVPDDLDRWTYGQPGRDLVYEGNALLQLLKRGRHGR